MERRKFTREFKLEAGRLIRERGVSYTQAAEDLGVHQSQVRDWVKKSADDDPDEAGGVHRPNRKNGGHGDLSLLRLRPRREPVHSPRHALLLPQGGMGTLFAA